MSRTFTMSRQALDNLLHIERELSKRVCAKCHRPIEDIDPEERFYFEENEALCVACGVVCPTVTLLEALLKVVTGHE